MPLIGARLLQVYFTKGMISVLREYLGHDIAKYSLFILLQQVSDKTYISKSSDSSNQLYFKAVILIITRI